MGTRALINVFDEDNTGLVTIYRQMDGYPSGLGLEIGEFLKDRVIVNGIGMADDRIISNGMGCLSASLIAHLKHGVGSIYIYPVGTTDCWEEYTYNIRCNEDKELILEIVESYGDSGTIFRGDVKTFILYCETC